jgi:hypothetical protein
LDAQLTRATFPDRLRTRAADLLGYAAIRYTVVTVVLAGLVVAGTWPHAAELSTTILGPGGDPAVGVRALWALDEQGGNPFTTERDLYLSAPGGEPVGRAVNVANALYVGAVWSLGQLVGWVVAFNLYNLLALVLAGTAMFVLVDRLRFGFAAAAFAAYVFAFNPNHVEKAFGHAPLVATGILPLLVLALVVKRTRPKLGPSLVAGLLLATAFYLNSYLGLFAFFVVLVFAAVECALPPERATRFDVLRSYYVVAVVSFVALVPTAFAWYLDPSTVASFASERTGVLPGGSASPQLYLLPGPRHPWLGGPMSTWLETHLSWEYTMFFGYTTLALAVAGVALAVVRHRRRELPRETLALVVFAVAVTVFGIWASLPPKVRIGEVLPLFAYTVLAALVVGLAVTAVRRRTHARGVRVTALLATALLMSSLWVIVPSSLRTGDFEVPTLAYFLRETTTLFRVFSRFGVLVGLGLVILAAYALSSLPRRTFAAALPVAALLLVAFELYVDRPAVVDVQDVGTPVTVRELARAASAPPTVMRVERTPEYVEWLERQPQGIVADYPNPADPHGRWAWEDVFYQTSHRHPLWQGLDPGEDQAHALKEYANDLDERLAATVLAVADVKYVVVHRDRYRALRLKQPTVMCGLDLVAEFPRHDVDVYRVAGDREASFAVRDRGFYSVANRRLWPEDRGYRWVPDRSEILLYSPRQDEVFLFGSAVSLGRPRELDVLDSAGEQVGAWEILERQTWFRFALPVEPGLNRFVFRTKPGAVRGGSADSRRRAIAVSSFTVSSIRMPVSEAARAGAEACPSES